MKYTALKAHLDAVRAGAAAPKPCYIVFGDDAWLRQSAVAMFRTLVEEDYASFNFTAMPASDGAEEAVFTLNTFPVFDLRRVVAVTDVTEKFSAADAKAFEDYLASPSPEAVLVFECDDGAEKAVNFKGAEKVDCSRLSEGEIAALVQRMLDAEPKRTIEPAALRELVTRTLADMSRISCEVAKLKAYCDSEIRRDDVCAMTAAEPDYQIFQLSDALGAKDKPRALRVLTALLDDGLRPMTVINLLYSYYRRMLHALLHKDEPDTAVAALLGVKPGALYHVRKVSGAYTQVKLKKCVDRLHELQCAVLTGKRAEESAMHEAVLTLMSQE